ncbi:MerR family regulatory protein [Peptococcaceae bacterium CEB3]|nr:MerR family regulatory protein [Peptococcaceae bacterium CEB3]
MASEDDPEESLGIKKAAHMLGVSEVSLRRWEKNGILVPLRTAGGHRRYPIAMLINFREHKMADEFRRKSRNVRCKEGAENQ